MNKIGLLGGTFDPPHIGHLLLAECAREQLGLDRVLFLPAGRPPHKTQLPVTAVSHRLAMTRLAIAGNPAFALDATDAERRPPHTTVTLLPLLQARQPQAQLWLLLGGDSLRDLPGWRQPPAIVAQCRLAVLPRPGFEADWPALERAIPGVTTAVDLLEGPAVALAGRQIRRWLAQGRRLRYALPAAVRDYIEQEKLYQEAVAAG